MPSRLDWLCVSLILNLFPFTFTELALVSRLGALSYFTTLPWTRPSRTAFHDSDIRRAIEGVHAKDRVTFVLVPLYASLWPLLVPLNYLRNPSLTLCWLTIDSHNRPNVLFSKRSIKMLVVGGFNVCRLRVTLRIVTQILIIVLRIRSGSTIAYNSCIIWTKSEYTVVLKHLE